MLLCVFVLCEFDVLSLCVLFVDVDWCGVFYDEYVVFGWLLVNVFVWVYWVFMCVGLKVGGVLLDGIVFGLWFGFDLGLMFDYVYCNCV